MQQISEKITAKLLGMLPQDKDFITPAQLLDHGIPGFIVNYIHIELEENFRKSISLHENKWLDTDNDAVFTAWKLFLSEINPSLRMPLSYAQSIIQKAVADVLLMLVEPRSSFSEFIFSDDKTLTFEDVISRCSRFTVYKHFCSALPRFMEKKGYKELSKEQCSHFISALDEKLISRYTYANWKKIFEPWKILIGPEIDHKLMRLFFEDKSEKVIAGKFAREKDLISIDKAIEVITNQDQPDVTASKPRITREKPIRLKEDISEETIENAVKDTDDYEGNSILEIARRAHKDQGNSLSKEHSDQMSADEKFNALFSRFQKPDDEDSDEANAVPMWQRFAPDDDNLSEESDETELNESEEIQDDEEIEENPPENLDDPVSNEIEEEPEAINPEADAESDTQKELPINELFNSEADQTSPPSNGKTAERALLKLVEDDKEYFVDNLFGGDEEVFHEVLEDLEECKGWKDAVRFLTEDVFRRNYIDIYSEPAVDFTDMLQEYFNQKS
ncbi:MAG: hypothetical protein WD267_05975 [Balneolales bacterium]